MTTIKIIGESIELLEQTTINNATLVAVSVVSAPVTVTLEADETEFGSIVLPVNGLYHVVKRSTETIGASSNGAFATSVGFA